MVHIPDEILREAGLLVVGDQLDYAAEESRLGQEVVRHLVYRLPAHAHVFHCVVRPGQTKL
jgi:hypothetical protein